MRHVHYDVHDISVFFFLFDEVFISVFLNSTVGFAMRSLFHIFLSSSLRKELYIGRNITVAISTGKFLLGTSNEVARIYCLPE